MACAAYPEGSADFDGVVVEVEAHVSAVLPVGKSSTRRLPVARIGSPAQLVACPGDEPATREPPKPPYPGEEGPDGHDEADRDAPAGRNDIAFLFLNLRTNRAIRRSVADDSTWRAICTAGRHARRRVRTAPACSQSKEPRGPHSLQTLRRDGRGQRDRPVPAQRSPAPRPPSRMSIGTLRMPPLLADFPRQG